MTPTYVKEVDPTTLRITRGAVRIEVKVATRGEARLVSAYGWVPAAYTPRPLREAWMRALLQRLHLPKDTPKEEIDALVQALPTVVSAAIGRRVFVVK